MEMGRKDSIGDMIDASFRIKGQCLAVNHHHALAEAIGRWLPWLSREPGAGIHPIQVAPSAHGWSPPRAEHGELWQLSKRTRLMLRIPIHREIDVAALVGKVLDVEPETIEVGDLKIRRLAPADPLFARHVVCERDVPEPSFLDWLMRSLEPRGITPRKVICGKWQSITTPEKTIDTRSVLVASLGSAASLRLQCSGLGKERTLGCGIFVPHKGIEPVRHTDDPD